jgi:hypothetical protein
MMKKPMQPYMIRRYIKSTAKETDYTGKGLIRWRRKY